MLKDQASSQPNQTAVVNSSRTLVEKGGCWPKTLKKGRGILVKSAESRYCLVSFHSQCISNLLKIHLFGVGRMLFEIKLNLIFTVAVRKFMFVIIVRVSDELAVKVCICWQRYDSTAFITIDILAQK